jgi:hypothetical protein
VTLSPTSVASLTLNTAAPGTRARRTSRSPSEGGAAPASTPC